MRLVRWAVLASCALGSQALAQPEPARPQDDAVVLVNATTSLGDRGGLARVSRVLDARGMRAQLPAKLAATLDGSNVLVADVDDIVAAVADLEYDRALEIIEVNEERLLQGAGSGDPIPALSQLFEWRGVIAVAREQPDKAVEQFRAAYRLNPGWVLDARSSTSAVRRLVKKAKREVSGSGRLLVTANPPEAVVSVDGRKARSGGQELVLPAGIHLVVISAPGRGTYAEIVDIKADELAELPITLEKETKTDRAAKIVDKIVAAPPGRIRLDKIKSLQKYTNSSRFLVIENSSGSGLSARLYDVGAIRVSRPIELDGSETSAEIASKVLAALEPDNLLEVGGPVEPPRSRRWYERWYVWVGAGALLGGGALGYHYATRDPTTIRGF